MILDLMFATAFTTAMYHLFKNLGELYEVI